MARLTITVEGEADEVREALRHLLGGDLVGTSGPAAGLPPDQQSTGDGEPTAAPPPPLTWTHDELSRLWAHLTDPARRVLREVADQPDGYRFEELERSLGLDMRRIGGSLSSVGHTMRRLYRVDDVYVRPWPLVGDKYKRVYLMDEQVAEMIRELTVQSGDEDGQQAVEEG